MFHNIKHLHEYNEIMRIRTHRNAATILMYSDVQS